MSPDRGLTRRTVLAAGAVTATAVAVGAPTRADALAASPTQVVDAKRRLNAQGYLCFSSDSAVDDLTTCAVLAYQKANHLVADGLLTLQVMTALKTVRRPTRFTASGNAVEVDLARQLVRIVEDGSVVVSLHATTGDGRESEYAGRTVHDHTPRGRFRLRAGTEQGERTDSLGVQFRPHDFCPGGYALYGRADLAEVRKPATHGGVAIHSTALLWLADHGHLPPGRLVVVV